MDRFGKRQQVRGGGTSQPVRASASACGGAATISRADPTSEMMVSAPIAAASIEARVTPSASVARKDHDRRADERRWRIGEAATRINMDWTPHLTCERVQLAREHRLRRLARQHETDVVEALALDEGRGFERASAGRGREPVAPGIRTMRSCAATPQLERTSDTLATPRSPVPAEALRGPFPLAGPILRRLGGAGSGVSARPARRIRTMR